ncbi:hypothetical protein OEA41_006329 [Lepraria neglecta]|uniref:Uncharacterized protein n=1 Tax=Lepraria neglecta TaxID=209136 RepID=A0AAD9Z8N4_9LECA|nr:hypothetical protein OEA41_006329 [Lepraria neglecta]
MEQAKETNSELVIVFDPVKLTLRTEKIRNLDLGKATNHERVPRWGSCVTLYKKEGSKRMIATLDLDKLDWISNMKRHRGFIKDLYVIPSEDAEHLANTV